MPEIIESFHWKLDDLESEIVSRSSKAPLLRLVVTPTADTSQGCPTERSGSFSAGKTAGGTACASRGADQITHGHRSRLVISGANAS